MHTFEVRTTQRECLIDITGQIQQAAGKAGPQGGLCTVFVPHTTAAVTVNENADPDVGRDLLSFLSELVPRSWPYRHREGNSDAHIKASLLGASVQVPIRDGRLILGTWQGIFFAEFDGPRTRSVHVVVQSA